MFESMETAGKTGYVLDTCVLRRICGNENFAVSLSCRIGFENSYVVVTSKALEGHPGTAMTTPPSRSLSSVG